MNSKKHRVNTLLNKYLSVGNLQHIQADLEHFVSETYNGDSNNNTINLRKLVFDVMNTIRADDRIQNLNFDEINDKTLKICKKIFNEQICTRDAKIFHQRKNIVNDNIPQPSSATTKDQNDLDSFINDRKSEYSSTTTSNELSSSNILKTIETKPLDEREFKTTLDNIINERNAFDQDMHQSSNNQPLVENFEDPKLNSLDFPNTNKNENIQDICNDNTHPKDFFKINSDINDIMKSRVLMIPSNASTSDDKNDNESLMHILHGSINNNNDNTTHKTIEKIKYILINSYDRDWINEPSRYKYKIKFSNSINTPVKVPYYENNPTVPFTKTDDYSGIPNKMGWVDSHGNFYNKYDETQSVGDIVGYEEVENVTDQDSNLSRFKNVTSIKINNITIPIENVFRHVNSYNEFNNNHFNFNFNFPYILLHIDEFNDVYDGTDNTIRKAFCQLQYDNHFVCPNGRNYVILKPVQNEQKIFYPTPLSTLPTLHISLLKPNGQLLNNSNDTFKILAIQPEQTYYLKINLTTFFEKRSFMINDYIRFKNFSIFKIQESVEPFNTTISDYNSFNSFINRTDGHEIIQIGEPNQNGFFNSFLIYAPGAFNFETGTFDLEENPKNALVEFNNNLIDADVLGNFYDDKSFQNGYVINMSLQHSISLTINVEEIDSKMIKSMS